MKLRVIIIPILLLVSVAGFARDPKRWEQIKKYRELVGDKVPTDELERWEKQRVQIEFRRFAYRIISLTEDQPFGVMEATGNSGAGFKNVEGYKSDFARRVGYNYRRVKAMGGEKAKLVVIMGATVDGFGVGYEVLQKLKTEGGLKDIVVAGMSSDEAVAYHLEGVEKGWGDVIAPNQDALLLISTYKDEQGHQSWEAKETPKGPSHTVDILLSLASLSHCKLVSMELFDGSKIAFTEAIEYAARARSIKESKSTSSPSYPRMNLVLHLGYGPSDKAVSKGKDKGYRAASQVVEAIKNHPEILSENLHVAVSVDRQYGNEAGPGRDLYDLKDFFKFEEGQHFATDAEYSRNTAKDFITGQQSKIESAKATFGENSPEVNILKSESAKAQALLNADGDIAGVLKNVETQFQDRVRELVATENMTYSNPGLYREVAEGSIAHSIAINSEALNKVKESLQKVEEAVRVEAATQKQIEPKE